MVVMNLCQRARVMRRRSCILFTIFVRLFSNLPLGLVLSWMIFVGGYKMLYASCISEK